MKIAVTARNFTLPEVDGAGLLRERGLDVVDYSAGNYGVGTPAATMVRLLADADAAITGLEPITEEVLRQCPRLKIISRRGIGYDSVDLDACRSRGVAVVRTTGTVESAVAEHVLAYILYFARRIDLQNTSMHRAEWNRRMLPGAKNRVLGLVGFGGIGREIAKRAAPFGMKVLYWCRHPEAVAAGVPGEYCPLDALLAQSDYVSVNVPLTDETRGMFGAEMLAKMKKDAVLINIARGPIVDAAALADALSAGRLRGAAVDVFDTEPCTDSPLLACENAVLTPHTASFTSENFKAMNECAAQNLLDFWDGTLDAKYRLV